MDFTSNELPMSFSQLSFFETFYIHLLEAFEVDIIDRLNTSSFLSSSWAQGLVDNKTW